MVFYEVIVVLRVQGQKLVFVLMTKVCNTIYLHILDLDLFVKVNSSFKCEKVREKNNPDIFKVHPR